MGVYLGEISIVNEKFVNFKPHYIRINNKFSLLSKAERQELLPESELENINFYSLNPDYAPEKIFHNREYCLFDFETCDLEDNFTYSGERNRTGYKIDISNIRKDKMRTLDEIGLCRLIRSKDIIGDLSNNVIETFDDYNKNPRLRITDSTTYDGMTVLLEIPEEANIVLGPFKIARRVIDAQNIVTIFSPASKHIIPALKYVNGVEHNIEEFGIYDIQTFISKNDEKCQPFVFDALPKDVLIKEFRDTLGTESFEDGKLNLSNIDNLIESYSASNLIGNDIPHEIKQKRLDDLCAFMTDEENLNSTFGFIGETIAKLILKYKDSEAFEPILRQLANDSDFMGQIQRINIINGKITEKEAELEAITTQIDDFRRHQEGAEKSASAEELIGEKREELSALQRELDSLTDKIGSVKSVGALQERLRQLNEDVDYKEKRERELDTKLQVINQRLDGIFSNSEEKAINFAFDGMLSSRMLQTAAQWESKQLCEDYTRVVAKLRETAAQHFSKRELIDYLCEQVGKYRPSYSKNMILNIFICIAQGFLTVFSGEPGTGKTSICNIVANTLGLTLPRQVTGNLSGGINPNRFIAISVERGWTSKRDFIGYYNPLTKRFDRSNRQLFDGLNILDIEAKGNSTDLPYLVLLDEANLSPMEYYWADFMNICDDLSEQSTVNLGEDFCFQVADALRFVATINNDHTTEALSPRLIDRAWVVKLPQVKPGTSKGTQLDSQDVRSVSQKAFMEYFGNASEAEITGAAKEVYEVILSQLRTAKISLSSRADYAIRRYWAVAQTMFENEVEYAMDASIVALDYAVSQRILPQIAGSGESFGKALNALAKTCSEKNLRISASILSEIVRKGDETMRYYQYFA